MKIYFTSARRSTEQTNKYVEKILDVCKNLGHDVNVRSVIKDVEDKAKKEDVNSVVKLVDDYSESFKANTKNILNADVVIVEGSFASTGVGVDLSMAINNRKPTLVLVSTDSKYMQKELESPQVNNLLTYKAYNDTNIEELIKDFINNSKKILDSKFILIIPPEIERYLTWASNKKGIRKAEIVRTSIEQYMEKDESYKKYMSNMEE